MRYILTMSPSLHIEYPDAWDHIWNRMRDREEIFSDETDYQRFIELLSVGSTTRSGLWDPDWCRITSTYVSRLLMPTFRSSWYISMRYTPKALIVLTHRKASYFEVVTRLFSWKQRRGICYISILRSICSLRLELISAKLTEISWLKRIQMSCTICMVS